MPERTTPSSGTTPFVLHGPGLTEMDAWRFGIAYCDAFDAIAEAQGSGLHLTITGFRRVCDGCDRQAEDFPPPAGWVSAPNGDDFCTACLIGGDR